MIAILKVIELRGRCPEEKLSMGRTGIGVAVLGGGGHLTGKIVAPGVDVPRVFVQSEG